MQVKVCLHKKRLVISVDTKKKELVGEFKKTENTGGKREIRNAFIHTISQHWVRARRGPAVFMMLAKTWDGLM